MASARNLSPAPVSRPIIRPPLSSAHVDVALADMRDVCALTRLSKSWIYAAVADGRFPAPAIKAPRMTRWRLADVRQWIVEQTGG